MHIFVCVCVWDVWLVLSVRCFYLPVQSPDFFLLSDKAWHGTYVSCHFPRLEMKVAGQAVTSVWPCVGQPPPLLPPLSSLRWPAAATQPDITRKTLVLSLKTSSLAKGQGSAWERFLCRIWRRIRRQAALMGRVACGMTNISSSTPTLFVYQVFSQYLNAALCMSCTMLNYTCVIWIPHSN